jgi:hypothetical protein
LFLFFIHGRHYKSALSLPHVTAWCLAQPREGRMRL